MTIQLPATYDEAAIAMTLDHWLALVGAMLTSDAGRLVLRNHIRAMLGRGAVERLRVIEAARAGHEDADRALREDIAERISRRDDLPTELAAYAQEALVCAPAAYPGGHNLADTWLRDVGIAVMVGLAVGQFGLRPTRNRASKRLSASAIVAAALARRGHNVGERQVERICRDHGRLAERLQASIPSL